MDFGKKEIIFTLPHILRLNDRERLRTEVLKILKVEENPGFLVRSLEELFLILELGEGANIPLILDTNLYTFNKEALKAYALLGAKEATASLEQTKKELLETNCEEKTLVVYGHVPVMVTAQCMVDNVYGCREKTGFLRLYDRKEKELFLHPFCNECYNVIYNGTPLSLLEEKEAVEELSPKRLRLDFTVEDKEETKEILQAFWEFFRLGKQAYALKKETTKGHFYKGID
jgi:putative protease